MKGYLITGLILLGISMFCGFMVFAVGAGSLFTPLNQIARPFVCGDQQMEVVQHKYSYQPGETTTTITAYCVDPQTGQKEDKTGLVQLVVGVIFGLVIFVVLGIAALRLTAKSKSVQESASEASPSFYTAQSPQPDSSLSIDDKLRKLKELRDKNLITDQDFEKKKSEILDNL